MTKKELYNIIDEEIQNVKMDKINEEITESDERLIRNLIRQEVSAIFFDLFKRRKTWGA
jgi:flagellar biosynthesis/type III secretory pathway chaperone